MKAGYMDFPRVVVQLDNFGYDTNGNVIARHTVTGYKTEEQKPSAVLYITRRRLQIGSSANRDDNALAVLAKAGLRGAGYHFVKREGDRSDGTIYLTYRKNNS